MRKTLPLFWPLLWIALLGPAGASSSPDTPLDHEKPIDELRHKYTNPSNANEKLRAGKDLLIELDRSGKGGGAEAQRVVQELLGFRPDDPQLLWRRGEEARLEGMVEPALVDFRRLVETNPTHPLAVRAQRALSALYFKLGRFTESLESDEKLLAAHLADPLPVLTRMAASYARLGRLAEVKEVIRQCQRLVPETWKTDPNLTWLSAELLEHEGERDAAAAAMLRFANLFPKDKRAGEALLRAARARGESGLLESAVAFSRQAAEKATDSGLRSASQMIRGEYLEKLDRKEEALVAYTEALKGGGDPAQVGGALRRAVDLTIQYEGTAAALELLAQQVRRPNPVVSAVARSHFLALIKIEGERTGVTPSDALVMVELARRVGIENPPPLLQLGAARLNEQIGDYAKAGAIYEKLVSFPGSVGQEARLGLARSRPESPPQGIEADHPERLAALKRAENWEAIEQILPDERLKGKDADDKRTLAARAAFNRAQIQRVEDLLDKVARPGGEASLLRADALALAGDWKAACDDYKHADPLIALGPERDWLEVRLAECEARAGHAATAKKRLKTLMASQVSDPALLAAEQLTLRLSGLVRQARKKNS